jgi:putative DNA primase/helicase
LAPETLTGPPCAPQRFDGERFKALGDGVSTLRHWRGGWWEWQRSHWREIEHRTVRAALYEFTDQASYENDKGETKGWAPNRSKIGDLSEALAAIRHLPDYTNQPSWLDSRMTGVIVACANGLLDIARQQLIPHTPLFFNQTSVLEWDEILLCSRWR